MANYFDTSFKRQHIFDDDLSIDGKYGKNNLRRGKWTSEEEAYASRLIQEFKAGLLPLTDGTTLRTFLSKLLNCDPMRISKKFVGQNCIGKQVFRRRKTDLDKLTSDDLARNRQIMGELEIKFLERLAQTNRCKSGSKDGKYFDDSFSNGPPVPWMIPPDPNTIDTKTETKTINSSLYSQDKNILNNENCSISNINGNYPLNQQIHGNISYYQSIPNVVHHSTQEANYVHPMDLNGLNTTTFHAPDDKTNVSYGNPNVNIIENSNVSYNVNGNDSITVKALELDNASNKSQSIQGDVTNARYNNSTNNDSMNVFESTEGTDQLTINDPVDSTDSTNFNFKRNQSIENFWMLVNCGDLPNPDDEVELVNGLWEETVNQPNITTSQPNATSNQQPNTSQRNKKRKANLS